MENFSYKVLTGNVLKEFKLRYLADIDVGQKTKALGVFDFRSFLNIGMLLTTSEKARIVRTLILDIVIATINEKTGGGTKYINRRDRDYLPAAIQEENYHKNLTDAVKELFNMIIRNFPQTVPKIECQVHLRQELASNVGNYVIPNAKNRHPM